LSKYAHAIYNISDEGKKDEQAIGIAKLAGSEAREINPPKDPLEEKYINSGNKKILGDFGFEDVGAAEIFRA